MKNLYPKRRLSDIIEAISHQGSVSFFLGAGISRSAGIPLAGEITAALGTQLLGEENSREPILEALASKPFFDPANPYASVLEARFPSQGTRASYFEELCLGRKPTAAHRAIAALLRDGVGAVIATTNFDRLMEYAIVRGCGKFPTISIADSLPEQEFTDSQRPRILKIHGDYLYGNICNLDHELSYARASMLPKLELAAKADVMIIAGYSGGDSSVMTVLETLSRRSECFRKGIYWLVMEGTHPNQRVTQFLRSLEQRGAGIIDIEGCDEFFSELLTQLGIPSSLPNDDFVLDFRAPLKEADRLSFVKKRLGGSAANEFQTLLTRRPDLAEISQTAAAIDFLLAQFEELRDLPRNLGEHIDRYVDLLAGALLDQRSIHTGSRDHQRLGDLTALGLATEHADGVIAESFILRYLEALSLPMEPAAYLMQGTAKDGVLENYVGLCQDSTATIKAVLETALNEAMQRTEFLPWPDLVYQAARLAGHASQLDRGVLERIVDVLLFELSMTSNEPTAAIDALSILGPRAIDQTVAFLLDDLNSERSRDFVATVLGRIGSRDVVTRLVEKGKRTGSSLCPTLVVALVRTGNPIAMLPLRDLAAAGSVEQMQFLQEALYVEATEVGKSGYGQRKQDTNHETTAEILMSYGQELQDRAFFQINRRAMAAKPQAAIQHIKQVGPPADLGLLIKVGRSLKNSGHLAQAEVLARESIERYPMLHFVYHDLALIHSRQGRVDAACRAYNIGIGLQPDYADYFSDFAVSMMKREDYDAARGLLVEALLIDFDNYRCWYNLAGVYTAPKKPAGRRTVGTISTNVGGIVEQWKQPGVPSYAEGANVCLRQVLALKPDHPTAQKQLDALAIFLDRPMTGEPTPHELSFVLRLEETMRSEFIEYGDLPANATAAVLLSEEHRLAGNFEAALEAQREAYRISPFSIGVLHNLNLLYRCTGKSSEALQVLEKALEIAPWNRDLLLNYAQQLSDAGKDEAAIDAAQKAIEVTPVSTEAWLALTRAFAKARKHDQARDALHRAIRLSGSWTWNLRSATQLAKDLGYEDLLSL